MVEAVLSQIHHVPEGGVIWRLYVPVIEGVARDGPLAYLYHFAETEEEPAGWSVYFDGPGVRETWAHADSVVSDLADGERYIAQVFGEIMA